MYKKQSPLLMLPDISMPVGVVEVGVEVDRAALVEVVLVVLVLLDNSLIIARAA
jgi:hypothetical protein